MCLLRRILKEPSGEQAAGGARLVASRRGFRESEKVSGEK
jgi:hypothetical protein